jgi:hypothetical protein
MVRKQTCDVLKRHEGEKTGIMHYGTPMGKRACSRVPILSCYEAMGLHACLPEVHDAEWWEADLCGSVWSVEHEIQ